VAPYRAPSTSVTTTFVGLVGAVVVAELLLRTAAAVAESSAARRRRKADARLDEPPATTPPAAATGTHIPCRVEEGLRCSSRKGEVRNDETT
jgi:hypothetical protein